MKVSLSMLLATSYAAPDVRKVPPRTPPQRLDTLMRFSQDFVDANVGVYRDEDKVNNQKAAIKRIHDMLLENYSKIDEDGLRKCSYFDPTSEHGGPRPDNTGKRAIKQLWVQKELCALGEYSLCLNRRKRRSVEDEFDPFDDFEAQLEQGERGNAQVRLSTNTAIAIRQLRTGFQKWVLRYMSECVGQVEYGYHSKRVHRVTDNIWNTMKNIVAYNPDNPVGKHEFTALDFDLARWGEHVYNPVPYVES